MSYGIQALKIKDDNYIIIEKNKQKIEFLSNLSRINIFVGENNSGKSRLLRNILSNEITWVPSNFSISEWNSTFLKISDEITKYCQKIQWDLPKEFTDKIAPLDDIKFFTTTDPFSKKYEGLIQFIEQIYVGKTDTRTGSTHTQYSSIGDSIIKIINENTQKFGMGFEKELDAPASKKIYIPILRGLLWINLSQGVNVVDDRDIYKNRIVQDYFKSSVQGFEIFTGLDTYRLIKDYLLGLKPDRQKIEDFQLFLSKNFFEGKEVTLIPYEKTHTIVLQIGEDSDRELFDLGDGLQALINLTLPLFLNKGDKLLVFIEEPEKLLHPGFQRKLIETFLNEPGFEKFQYFLTTHSNHFLDISLDFTQISIYSVRKEFDTSDVDSKSPKFIVKNLSSGDKGALELLGVRNSSVFLSNCTIWVEGVTDRKYYKKFLEMYREKNGTNFSYKEDLHYSFVEYSGSNLSHWSFLDDDQDPINIDRLYGKIFLIADNPGEDSKKQQRHAQLKKKLGEKQFVELRSREVENLLLPKILKEILAGYGETIESIREFSYEEYFNKPLGMFLESLISPDKKKRHGSYADGNSVSKKNDFCGFAISKIKTWGDLSEESQKITEKMVDFIKENNS